MNDDELDRRLKSAISTLIESPPAPHPMPPTVTASRPPTPAGLQHDSDGSHMAARTIDRPRRRRVGQRVVFLAATAGAAVVGLGLWSFLGGGSDQDSTIGASTDLSAELVSPTGWFGDPEGDIVFVHTAIGEAIDRCMTQAGFPGWAETEGAYLSPLLPAFELGDGGSVVGYEARYAGRFNVRDGVTGAPGEIEALHGDGDEDSTIQLGPTVTKSMGGCTRIGHQSVLVDAELVWFLQGEFDLLNLVPSIIKESLASTDADREWSECMAELGFEIADPFRVGYLPVEGTEQEVALGDYQCRSDTDLEALYNESLRVTLARVQSDYSQRLFNLAGVAATARQRISTD